MLTAMSRELTRRGERKRQMVRTGYASAGIGVLVLVIGLAAGSLVLDVIGLIVIVVAGWATRALRSL